MKLTVSYQRWWEHPCTHPDVWAYVVNNDALSSLGEKIIDIWDRLTPAQQAYWLQCVKDLVRKCEREGTLKKGPPRLTRSLSCDDHRH